MKTFTKKPNDSLIVTFIIVTEKEENKWLEQGGDNDAFMQTINSYVSIIETVYIVWETNKSSADALGLSDEGFLRSKSIVCMRRRQQKASGRRCIFH